MSLSLGFLGTASSILMRSAVVKELVLIFLQMGQGEVASMAMHARTKGHRAGGDGTHRIAYQHTTRQGLGAYT